jgi:inorganic triphosphatase YgiF
MSETELKYLVPESAVRSVDAGLRRLGARKVTIETRYFDTDDGRLAAAMVSLRLRRSRGRWEQTVKSPGRHAADRLEETVPRPGRWGAAGPAVEPSLHHGTPAGARLKAALRTQGEPPPLVLSSTTRVVRQATEIVVGGSRVEVAFDRGTIVAGSRELPVREVEYELKAGDAIALVDIARAGVVAHGMQLSTLTKAARGDALARHAGRLAAVRSTPPELDADMSASALRLAIVKACVDQVVANASILGAGGLDDEVVHQLRVGLRRLRTAVRELGAASGRHAPAWEPAITDLFRRLGEYRDRSQVADAMRIDLAAAGSPAPDLRARAAEPIDPIELMRSVDVQLALLGVLAEVMDHVKPDAVAGPAAASEARGALADIAARLSALHAAVRKAAKRFARVDDAERHRVRKRLKRLRYLAEMIGPLYDAKAVERYLARLRPAQDALGAYVDEIVAIELARENVASGDARAWFNVGWLSAQLPRGVRRCRRALESAATARPFWGRA